MATDKRVGILFGCPLEANEKHHCNLWFLPKTKPRSICLNWTHIISSHWNSFHFILFHLISFQLDSTHLISTFPSVSHSPWTDQTNLSRFVAPFNQYPSWHSYGRCAYILPAYQDHHPEGRERQQQQQEGGAKDRVGVGGGGSASGIQKASLWPPNGGQKQLFQRARQNNIAPSSQGPWQDIQHQSRHIAANDTQHATPPPPPRPQVASEHHLEGG